jgi:hypothetical protein
MHLFLSAPCAPLLCWVTWPRRAQGEAACLFVSVCCCASFHLQKNAAPPPVQKSHVPVLPAPPCSFSPPQPAVTCCRTWSVSWRCAWPVWRCPGSQRTTCLSMCCRTLHSPMFAPSCRLSSHCHTQSRAAAPGALFGAVPGLYGGAPADRGQHAECQQCDMEHGGDDHTGELT